MRSLLVMVVVVAACGNDGKDGVQPKVDAGSIDAFVDPFRDAPATSTVQVTVSGKVTAPSTTGSMPLASVKIVAYRNADETTPIGTTTSDGAGNYSLTVQTNGESIDGYLVASLTDYLDTYLYPPYPLTMDFSNASVLMISQATLETLSNLAGGDQQPGNGLIGLVVTDAGRSVCSAEQDGDDDAHRWRRLLVQRAARSGHGQGDATDADARISWRKGSPRRADDDGHRSLR
jgi:hypothetical protein